MRSRVRVQLCASLGIAAIGLLPILGAVHAVVERHIYCTEHAAFEDVGAASAPVVAGTSGALALRAGTDDATREAAHTQCVHAAYRACAPAADPSGVVAEDFPAPAYEAPRPLTLSPLARLTVAPKSSPPVSA